MSKEQAGPILSIGELLWDLLPKGPRLGGASTNFAVLSARLGGEAALVSCVGEDELGRKALESLQTIAGGTGTSLDLSGIQTDPSLATGTVAVALDAEGRPGYQIHHPVAWDAIEPVASAVALARQAGVVCFGTLAQREVVSREAIRSLVEAAKPGCLRVCDLNLRMPFCTAEVLRWSLAHAQVVKVSDEELPEVARLLGDPDMAAALLDTALAEEQLTQTTTSAARALFRHAPRCTLVAVTLGPHGSLLLTRTDACRHHGFRVKAIDTVGAGDAFAAGLVYASLRGASLQAMSAVSNRCGSFVASQPGATPELPVALLDEIEGLLGA